MDEQMMAEIGPMIEEYLSTSDPALADAIVMMLAEGMGMMGEGAMAQPQAAPAQMAPAPAPMGQYGMSIPSFSKGGVIGKKGMSAVEKYLSGKK